MASNNIISRFFNRRTNAGKRITAGGQITAPGSTIITTQPQRFGMDLSQYMMAVRAAENMDYTQRTTLYDMYDGALLDTHLLGVLGKRKNAVLSSPIEFWRDGIPDDKVNVQIKSPWFNRFVKDILDAQFMGFTLMQFSLGKDGFIEYFNVPRKHVDPQLRLIRRYQTDITGISFEEYPNLLFVEGEMKLGLLAACLPWVIRKNGTMGDWAQFSELFGMPIRDYSYDAADEDARKRTLQDAMNQGSAGAYIHPDGTKLSFIEAGNKTGSADVYDKLVQVCNAEMSKAILGNTLTTEASDTGTQALGTVHKQEEEGIAKSDRNFILSVLNYDMTDIFSSLGINTDGGEFVFVDADSVSKVEKAALFNTARNVLGLPIDDDYMYQELGIEKPKNYNQLKAEAEKRREEVLARLAAERETAGGETATNRLKGFFGDSPDYRALNW